MSAIFLDLSSMNDVARLPPRPRFANAVSLERLILALIDSSKNMHSGSLGLSRRS